MARVRATAAFPRYLAMALLVLFYAAFLWASMMTRGLYDYAGVDLRGFIASAQIVGDHGFAAVYDLEWQAMYQQSLYEYSPMATKVPLDVNPTPYLPPFVAVFLLLLPFNPVLAYPIWILFNVILLLFCLRHLVRHVGIKGEIMLVPTLVLSLPVFFTVFFGQVNVFLLIFLGESLASFSKGKNVWGGAWLAGLLLKPQMLAMFIPGLFLWRNWYGLFGFALFAGAILGVSILMAGVEGMRALVQLMSGYISSQNLVTNFPQSMMNWRALALNLESISKGELGWTIALPGMIVTGAAGLCLWLFVCTRSASELAVLWLGTMAATLALAWHSHAHTALALLAPLIFLHAHDKLPDWLLNVRVYLPAILFLGAVWIYTPLAIVFGFADWAGPSFAHIVTGFALLTLNLVLLGWSFRSLRQGEAQRVNQ